MGEGTKRETLQNTSNDQKAKMLEVRTIATIRLTLISISDLEEQLEFCPTIHNRFSTHHSMRVRNCKWNSKEKGRFRNSTRLIILILIDNL